MGKLSVCGGSADSTLQGVTLGVLTLASGLPTIQPWLNSCFYGLVRGDGNSHPSPDPDSATYLAWYLIQTIVYTARKTMPSVLCSRKLHSGVQPPGVSGVISTWGGGGTRADRQTGRPETEGQAL